MSKSLAREELKFSPRHKLYLKSVEKWHKKLLKSFYTFNMHNPFAPANIYKLGVNLQAWRFLNILFERHVTSLSNSYNVRDLVYMRKHMLGLYYTQRIIY